MISQGFGEVSGIYFSPEGPDGAAGQHYIIALPYQASRSGEIKSSMPCSRDTMNSRNRLVKRINPGPREGKHDQNQIHQRKKGFAFHGKQREISLPWEFTEIPHRGLEEKALLPLYVPWPLPAL